MEIARPEDSEPNLPPLPEEIIEFIKGETEKDVAPDAEDDPDTAEFNREVQQDYRETEYRVLEWLQQAYEPSQILYAASGHDQMPKLVFGEDQVIHTSLEHYQSAATEPSRYFPSLRGGLKVIADNRLLPFSTDTFTVLLLLGSTMSVVGGSREELLRVVEPNGIILLDRSVLTIEEEDPISYFTASPDLTQLPVPGFLQSQGWSEAEFFLFQKK